MLVVFAVYGALASPLSASPTLAGRDLGPDLQPLEIAVSQSPEDADALEALTEAYLERSAPGLAQAALDRAPPGVRSLARVADLEARSLAALGLAEQALTSQERAIEACTVLRFGAGAPNHNETAAGAPNHNETAAGAPNHNETAAPTHNETAAPNQNETAVSCSSRMLVHAERRVRWLRELVRLEADDRLPDSAAASLAYRLAVREVRLALP